MSKTIGYIPLKQAAVPQTEPAMPPVNTAEERPAAEPSEEKAPVQKKKA